MKLPMVLLVAVLLGSGVGATLAYWSVGSVASTSQAPISQAPTSQTTDPSVASEDRPATAATTPLSATAIAVVDEPNYQFGTMLRGATQSHQFMVRNEGTAPLTLVVGKTSCKCTLGDVSNHPIPPGGSAPVRLSWTAKVLAGPFRQTATIITNDPNNNPLQLNVEGSVTEISGVSPGSFSLGEVDTDSGAEAVAYVMSFDSTELVVTAKMADTTEQPERYTVLVEPVEPSAAPDKNALATTKITVQSAARLPIGSIHEWISLQTNLVGHEEFLMPITGRVRGAISVRSRAWSEASSLLNLGIIPGDEGGESIVLLSCRGPHAEEIQFTVEQVDPPELVVEVGERRKIRDGLTHTRLRVAIPPGTRPMVRTKRTAGTKETGEGDGQIRLKTNHPQSPEMNLGVRVIVQG